MHASRPALRDLFLAASRRLEVHFFTSNIEKFLQARMVFEENGLILRHFHSRSEPYSEDYAGGSERLLSNAIREILQTVGRGSIFFVEDTSLRIDSLSTCEAEVPGLRVKEWFKDITFEKLDLQLQEHGNDRRATVRSSIGLHLPRLNRPLFFTGETRGRVASHAPDFDADVQHPWLTPTTFNGWFVPDGSTKVLGNMTFEESWSFDFRVRALMMLLDRLEEYAAILNLPTSAFSRSLGHDTASQLSLFLQARPTLVVVGRTCAGKTTFGHRAHSRLGYRSVDASSVLRGLGNQYDQVNSKESAFDFAKRILAQSGPDVVARRILHLYAYDTAPGVVITGFRTIQELEAIQQHSSDVRIILIESSERTRFERYLRRNRPGDVATLPDFRKHDQQQWLFGLLRVAEDFADIRIVNEGSLGDYMAQVDSVLEGTPLPAGVAVATKPRHSVERNQLFRCLKILNAEGRPLTTEEIEEVTTKHGSRIRHNNANKVLRKVPELANRYEVEDERVRYEITAAGRAYLRLIESLYLQSKA